jgi:glycosyltransferase involved in cell wall biosynthesis
MRTIIFSWEYPPRVVGQLADFAKLLASSLVKEGVETCVVTYHDYLTGGHDDPDGVKVIRVTNPVRTHIGVLTWVLTLNQEVERAAANSYYSNNRSVDIVNAIDWHFIPAAVTLKKGLDIPFVYVVESLEDHRSHGANSPFNMAIRSIEWLGMFESERLIVKSSWMKDEIIRIYKVPAEKIKVILPDSKNLISDFLETYKDTLGGIAAIG